jgi:nucleoside-diphosphate-sugar epimerase
MAHRKITVLGVNGHVGHAAAQAFVDAGWEVTGFGRSNRDPISGMRFVAGDALKVDNLRAAIGDSEVVFNALNLPYHQWGEGRMEALYAGVLDAMGTDGKTMLFPASIYNYDPANRVITPDLAQNPPTPRGAIRVRVEQMYEAAARKGGLQIIVLRAGDFFGPHTRNDWFDQAMLREVGKGKAAVIGKQGVAHAWAYLPDLGRALVILADERAKLGAYETFHYAGNFVTPEQMTAAIHAAAPTLKISSFPWLVLSLIGITDPISRDMAKMGYLWRQPMQLKDGRLDAMLGPNFATPFAQAVAETVRPFLSGNRSAA